MKRRSAMEPRYLECVACQRQKTLHSDYEVPGQCVCRTRHPYPWRVLAQPRPSVSGHVIVMGHKGWQDITRTFQENPNGWKPYPVKRGEHRREEKP